MRQNLLNINTILEVIKSVNHRRERQSVSGS